MSESTIYITINATAAVHAMERVRKALEQLEEAVADMSVGILSDDPAQITFHADSLRIKPDSE